jgi:hypothetical protein
LNAFPVFEYPLIFLSCPLLRCGRNKAQPSFVFLSLNWLHELNSTNLFGTEAQAAREAKAHLSWPPIIHIYTQNVLLAKKLRKKMLQ